MVRILSNGDIVPDDDPRAQAAGSRGNSAGDNSNRPRQVCCKYITIRGCDVTVTLSRSSARDWTLVNYFKFVSVDFKEKYRKLRILKNLEPFLSFKYKVSMA